MSSRRQRKQFDELVSRVFLLLIGSVILGVSGVFFYNSSSLDSATVIVISIFIAIGLSLCFVSLVCSKKTVCAWADNTGNHEILILFILAALGVAYIIRKFNKST